MTITIEAVFENGVLKPKKPLDLAEGTHVELTMRMPAEKDDPFADIIGICHSGPVDGAANHDKYLREKRRP
jgi:predicted DNA-binding antitoxin AbrB/MazE fold protein